MTIVKALILILVVAGVFRVVSNGWNQLVEFELVSFRSIAALIAIISISVVVHAAVLRRLHKNGHCRFID